MQENRITGRGAGSDQLTKVENPITHLRQFSTKYPIIGGFIAGIVITPATKTRQAKAQE